MLALRSLKPVINRKLITRQESVRRKSKKDKTKQNNKTCEELAPESPNGHVILLSRYPVLTALN